MNSGVRWLTELLDSAAGSAVDGLLLVAEYRPTPDSPPEVVGAMEKAGLYGADAVFFEAGRNGKPPVAQAFVFASDRHADDTAFAELHRRLWSWGGVPLVYRRTLGRVELFRCAHKPDFVSPRGQLICNPVKSFSTTSKISAQLARQPWWDPSRLRNGTLWDDPAVCRELLSARKAAYKSLIDAVSQLSAELNDEGILRQHLRRKLLILSLLIAYLEERKVLSADYFGQFLPGATKFFHVLANGEALISLLAALEERFNGHVFVLDAGDRDSLRDNGQLARFARLVEGRQEQGGQLTLWKLYSFKDLPVELISHIYQLFVTDTDASVYTPPFLVRLMLDEALSWERLDRIQQQKEIILDPACGSGVFLVEAYKRLVLHWRSRNGWTRPDKEVLKKLLMKVHGIDLEPGAVELSAFSLCLALCDALEPATLRESVKLFPILIGETIHQSCFFEAKEHGLIRGKVGVVVGNPPFKSQLTTDGATRSYTSYQESHSSLPDKQLAYLFLHEGMEILARGGVLCMLQEYNFLYNQQSLGFRHRFIARWDVREVLDFISVRGLFRKGGADTKVVVVLAEATAPQTDRMILHATFRRSGRVDSEQGFDIDYYDLHWVPVSRALRSDSIWRANLLGGDRVLAFADRLRTFRTLGQCVKAGWDVGEGFIAGNTGRLVEAPHITGELLLEPQHLKEGASLAKLRRVTATRFKSPYTRNRFQSPMVLIHEHEDLAARCFRTGYYTYKHKIVGFCVPKAETHEAERIAAWMKTASKALRAFVTASGTTTFTQKASWVGLLDIKAIPYPENLDLGLSTNEQIIVDDIVDLYRDFVRRGEGSEAMRKCAPRALSAFATVFARQISAVYRRNPLQVLDPLTWPGVICQPFAFDKGRVDWHGAEELAERLDALLHEQKGISLHVTRIARIYDDSFIFLLKPNRLRYWMRSIALRDADETLSDLRAQGF